MTDDLTVQYVLMALPRGRDNARSLSDLAESLHLLRRTVEHSVQALRLDGWPVASGPDGIWLGSVEDVEATLRSLRGRMRNQYTTMLALRKTARRMRAGQVQQTSLFPELVA